MARAQDRGPNVTVSGSPAPSVQVYGEIDELDENGNNTIVQFGDTIPTTVTATAYGISNKTGLPNQINELSLWSIKINPGPPRIGAGTGGDMHDDLPWEAPHTDEYVSDDSTHPDSSSNGTPVAAPSYLDGGGVARTWVFKWLTGTLSPGTSYTKTWNLYYQNVPGHYWYSGEAQDVWSTGGFSFWSPVLGDYWCDGSRIPTG